VRSVAVTGDSAERW